VPAIQAMPGDIVGTIYNVTETKGIYINITESNITSLHGIIQVVLSVPITNLQDYKGKELRFDVLGRDILGRPIVDPFLGNTRIEDLNLMSSSNCAACSGDTDTFETGTVGTGAGGFNNTSYSDQKTFKSANGVFDVSPSKVPT
jgi:hypothetical protein